MCSLRSLAIRASRFGNKALPKTVRNLFVCLGDPTRIGDYPAATDNVDVVPTGLISLVKESLNEGRDQVGSSIGEPTNFPKARFDASVHFVCGGAAT